MAITIGLAQLAPVWLQKEATLEKILTFIAEAGKKNCDLVVFGEGLLPGYPFWLSFANGASFNDQMQKELYAHYVSNAIDIQKGELAEICTLAKSYQMAIYLGIIERAQDRGGHSLYCSLVFIDKQGIIKSVHRKLQPTYEERLVWSAGDGHGLQVHSLEEFSVGGLNCWENWMPLARTALYALGENIHVAVWPGAHRNTIDITPFIAKESRSYVISVSGLLTKKDIPSTLPYAKELIHKAPESMADGGSCIAAPDGEWVIPPVVGKEGVFTANITLDKVLQERQNFDPSGHYSRPDVTKLTVNRNRQKVVDFSDDTEH